MSIESKSILDIFARNVKKRRNELGISQEKLAELSGLHRTYIGMIERSEKKYNSSEYSENIQGFKRRNINTFKRRIII